MGGLVNDDAIMVGWDAAAVRTADAWGLPLSVQEDHASSASSFLEQGGASWTNEDDDVGVADNTGTGQSAGYHPGVVPTSDAHIFDGDGALEHSIDSLLGGVHPSADGTQSNVQTSSQSSSSSSLASNSQIDSREDTGLVGDWDMNKVDTLLPPDDANEVRSGEYLKDELGDLPSEGGSAGPLIDIGMRSCGKPAMFRYGTVKGRNVKYASLIRGTGFALQGVSQLLSTGASSQYTVMMRVRFSNISCYQRLVKTQPTGEEGLHLCDSLRVYPLRGGSIPLERNRWYDIGLATNAQRETFTTLDGVVVKGVVAGEDAWYKGIALSDSMLFFNNNDLGTPSCNMGGAREVSVDVARIKLYSRILSLSHMKMSLDLSGFYAPEYTYVPSVSCACEQMECQCTRVCDCKSECSNGNIAIGKQATQSSEGWGGAPWKAVRGYANTNYWSGSCTHTGYNWEPWWRLDLGKETKIHRIDVLNRGDCCEWRINGFEVRVGNDESSWKEARICGGAVPALGKHWAHLQCATGMQGRYVWVVIPNKRQYLHFCGMGIYFDQGFEKGPCKGGGRSAATASSAATLSMMGVSSDQVHDAAVMGALRQGHAAESTILAGVSQGVDWEDDSLSDSATSGGDAYITVAVLPTAMTWVWQARPNQNFASWMEGSLAVLSVDSWILLDFSQAAATIEQKLSMGNNVDVVGMVDTSSASTGTSIRIRVWEASLRVYSTDKTVNCSVVDLLVGNEGSRDHRVVDGKHVQEDNEKANIPVEDNDPAKLHWSEETVTWNTRPKTGTPVAGAQWNPQAWVVMEDEQLSRTIEQWFEQHKGNGVQERGDSAGGDEDQKASLPLSTTLALTCAQGTHGMDGVAGRSQPSYSPRLVIKYSVEDASE